MLKKEAKKMKKSPNWSLMRDVYKPKDFKESPIQAMIQSKTLAQLQQL